MSDTQTPRSNASTIDSRLTPTEIFDLLRDDRRRYILHTLTKRTDAVDLNALATAIVQWEQKMDIRMDNHYERVVTDLAHHHLPRLLDAEILVYQHEQETVTLCDTAISLTPYLELAANADFN
ncbi:DUF7344 domain-containing protein [Haladaptatus halobius]|uniref:DUF7344 domain-containing protein n=1 Tax=Haladaptatus halobius TaxID=2884875 RepID=UPI001D0AA0C1|nr:hypothetical protein [Haladaptatus halobius]